VLGVVLAIALVGAGVAVYDAGVAQGIAEASRAAGQGQAAQAYPYYGPWFRPFGFGFFGLLFPLLFFFLIVGLVRAAIWRPYRGWHEPGRIAELEALHRRMHESQSTTSQASDA
jgi:hypothetical protein